MSSGMNVRVRLLGGLCQPRGQRSALGGGRRHRESLGSSPCFADTGEGQVVLPSLAPHESVIPAVATAAVATVARFHRALPRSLESSSPLSRTRKQNQPELILPPTSLRSQKDPTSSPPPPNLVKVARESWPLPRQLGWSLARASGE